MTVVVTHTTPADGSFSATGAAAWNADHALSGVGTMAEQNKTSVDIEGGTIDNTTVGATTPAAGTFTTLTATGQTSLGGVADVESLRVSASGGGSGSNNYVNIFGTFGSSNPLIASGGTGANAGLAFRIKGTGAYTFGTGGSSTNIQFQVANTASAVNYVQVTGNATTGTPIISGQGSDTNVNLGFVSKGSGEIRFASNASGSNINFRVLHTTSSAVNYGTVTGAAAGSAPVFGVAGSDTNIDLTLTPKGTGTVRTSGTGIQLVGATSGYVGLKGAAVAGSTTYTLPAADGTSGQVLSTNGSGVMSWATASGGGALAKQTNVFDEASSATYTAPANTQWVKITAVGSGGNTTGVVGRRCTGASSGGVAIKWLAMTAGQTLTYNLPAGGAATVSSGTLTIDTITAARGSDGITTAYANSSTSGPAGGTATGGDINIGGGQGGNSYGSSTTTATNFSGAGGDCPGFGTGGGAFGATTAIGQDGSGRGSGASGSHNSATNAFGRQGIIIFEAY